MFHIEGLNLKLTGTCSILNTPSQVKYGALYDSPFHFLNPFRMMLATLKIFVHPVIIADQARKILDLALQLAENQSYMWLALFVSCIVHVYLVME